MATRAKPKAKVRAVAPVKGAPTALFETALAHHRAGRLDEADAIYQRILRDNPRHHDSLHLAGMVAYARADFAKAEALIGQAIALQPKADIYLGNLGNVLRSQGRLDEAIARYREAIAANPSNPTPYGNMGNALSDQGRLAEAIDTYEQALRLKPDFYEALFNLGLTRRAVGDVDGSLDTFRRATKAFPELAEAHYSLGQTLLLKGELAAGWAEYDWRWKLDEYAWLRNIHGEFTQPRWDGAPLLGKTLLVYAEQGMGDTLHFIRLLPAVAKRVGRVVFAAHPRLLSLLAPTVEAIPNAQLVSLDTIPLPNFDAHSPLLSLPRVLGINALADIPVMTPYLKANPSRVAQWRERLSKIEGIRIGIAWQGNPSARIDKGRSPPLAAFAPLAAVPGVRLIALQQRDGLEQLDNLPPGMQVERLGDEVDVVGAFVDTAAIMANLDLLIVSDSAIAHLAGGLGAPTWVPLKKIPDWRWLLEGETNPWYTSVKLFRQEIDGDWAGVFNAMAAQLPTRFADRLVNVPSPAQSVPSVNVPAGATSMPLTPVSWGELIDKISILDIKSERLTDATKLSNVRRELAELIAVRELHFPSHKALAEVYGRLKKVNEALWQIEDDIRDCERAKNFASRFVELARAVYVTNDLRGDLKREINELLGSTLKEEKSYKPYVEDQAAAAKAAQQAAEAAKAQSNPAQVTSTVLAGHAVTPTLTLASGRDYSRLDTLVSRVSALPRQTIDAGLDRSVSVQMLDRLQKESVLLPGRQVVDVAAGNGEVLEWLRSHGIAGRGLVCGRDIEALRQRQLDVILGDDTLLAEMPKGGTDVIWSHQALQRSLAPFHTLSEYRRLLAAGGYAYIDVPAPDTVSRHQAVGNNYSLFGHSMWQELFGRAGFTQVWGIELASTAGEHRDAVWAFLLRSTG